MDLIERRLSAAANIVLNRYLTETRRDDDLDALAALPLFLSVRAAIRAKVTAARAKDMKRSKTRRGRAKRARLFRAGAELLAPPQPQLIAVGGLSGTGKSLLARALAPRHAARAGRGGAAQRRRAQGAVRRRRERAAAAGGLCARGDRQGLCRDRGQGARACSPPAIRRSPTRCSPTRTSAPPSRRRQAAPLSTACSSPPTLATRVSRVGARTGDASDADAAVARAQEQYDLGALDWASVDASGTPEETLRRARAALASLSYALSDPLPRRPAPWRRPQKQCIARLPRRFSAMNAHPKPSAFSARHLAVGLAGYCAFINLYSPQSILPLLSRRIRRQRRRKSPPSSRCRRWRWR